MKKTGFLHFRRFPQWNVFSVLFSMSLGFLFLSCANHPAPESEASFGGEAPPCEGCAKQGTIRLKMVDSMAWEESVPGFSWQALPAPVGILPFLEVRTEFPKGCKICHSLSPDGAEFDFGSRQDSALAAIDSSRGWTLLVAGLQVPEADSLLLKKWMDSLARQPFVDQQPLTQWKPWKERGTGGEVRERAVPRELRSLLARMASRWGVSSLVIPLHLFVQVDPDAGSEGGFRYQVVWSLWDAQAGRLLWLSAADFSYETEGDVAPDRDWSVPFWKWLGSRLVQSENRSKPSNKP